MAPHQASSETPVNLGNGVELSHIHQQELRSSAIRQEDCIGAIVAQVEEQSRRQAKIQDVIGRELHAAAERERAIRQAMDDMGKMTRTNREVRVVYLGNCYCRA